jgi:aminoglycoside phosphotransferase (APT) family kinase protein
VLAAILDRAPVWPEILARLVEGPQTLIHNDTRLDNLFFTADGSPCFIDWQVVARGRGTQDVGNLLAGSMDSDDLAEHWGHLLKRYHARLVANGVGGYSFDDCVAHYRQNIVYPLGAGMALLGAMDIGDGRGLGDRIVTRCLRHIAKLESFKAL